MWLHTPTHHISTYQPIPSQNSPVVLTGSKLKSTRHPDFPGQILIFCLQSPLIFKPGEAILFLQRYEKLSSEKWVHLWLERPYSIPLIHIAFPTGFTRIRVGFYSHQHSFHVVVFKVYLWNPPLRMRLGEEWALQELGLVIVRCWRRSISILEVIQEKKQ